MEYRPFRPLGFVMCSGTTRPLTVLEVFRFIFVWVFLSVIVVGNDPTLFRVVPVYLFSPYIFLFFSNIIRPMSKVMHITLTSF